MADEILIQYWDAEAQCTRVRVADPLEAAALTRIDEPADDVKEGE